MVEMLLDIDYQDEEEILQLPEVTSVAAENAELENIIVRSVHMHLM